MPGNLRADVETLTAAIARSPIVVGQLALRRRLPAGFEPIDAAILAWLAAEARRLGRDLVRM